MSSAPFSVVCFVSTLAKSASGNSKVYRVKKRGKRKKRKKATDKAFPHLKQLNVCVYTNLVSRAVFDQDLGCVCVYQQGAAVVMVNVS